MTWWQWVLVGLAGAAGAPLRYVVDTLVSDLVGSTFPLGTFVVNVSGSFGFGLLSGLAIYHGLPGAPKVILGAGFLGAYTTFSTFSFETIDLLQGGETRLAARNALLSAMVGAAAAAAGLALASL